jgi:S1-C subfamily serine protease
MTAGDVIVSVNGYPVFSLSSVQALLGTDHPGDKVSISWDDPVGHAHVATLVLPPAPSADAGRPGRRRLVRHLAGR